jgi:hypothetical protein
MHLNRHRGALALAVVAAALAAAAPAQASRFDLRLARFTAQFEGQRTVKWNEPRWEPTSSNTCYEQHYIYASGEESWKVKSKPAKLMFVQTPGSKHVLIHAGTWDPNEFAADNAFDRAAGIITRSASRISGWQPGPCGGEPGLDPARNQKCGSRLPTHEIDLDIDKGKLIPAVGTDTSTARGIAPFTDCEIQLPRLKPPDATQLPEYSWPTKEIAGRVSIAELFGKHKTVTITGGRPWNDVLEFYDGKNKVSTSATFTWKLTLTRAKAGTKR